MQDNMVTKKRRMILLVILFLAAGIGFTLSYLKLKSDSHRKVTFEECIKAGGKAWAVDIYDPDICPACAEYAACADHNSGAADLREACPQVIACTACVNRNFPYPDRCPDGLQKIGEISDAEIWFQCCK
jgi:hypothetical protein